MINRKKSATVDSETTQSIWTIVPVPSLRSMCVNGEPDPFREVEIASLTHLRTHAPSGLRERTMDMETKIPVPTGISATNSSIGRWFKRVGEPVTIADPLVEVESDNVTVEVLAPATGILSEILLRDGQLVVGNTTLGSITEFGNGMAATQKQPAPANQIS
jgi:biotin carboxyl carrier protein